jgi:acetyl esterase/lipase
MDVPYYPGGERHTLDVFAPQEAKGAPVVLFVHGGGWVRGDKNFYGLYRGLGRFLAGNGVVTLMTNYRLSPEVRHPEHIKDIARAFAWTRRHAAEYGGDPDRIILAGHSAGGHLVALLATNESFLKDPELKLAAADRAAIRGVIGVCGVYQIPTPEEFGRMAQGRLGNVLQEAGVNVAEVAGITGLLVEAGKGLNPFRRAFGDDPEVCKSASPLAHVRKGLPPFLLLYAEKDLPGLPEMAIDFAAALKRTGNVVTLRQMAGRTHSRILFNLPGPEDAVGKELLTFIATNAGPRP